MQWDSSASQCTTLEDYTIDVADANGVAGDRACSVKYDVEGWVTCSDTDPLAGVAAANTASLPTIPPHLTHKQQCVESCRAAAGQMLYAIYNDGDKQCSCTSQLNLPTECYGPSQCGTRKYKVYRISEVPGSPDCNHLYYTKQVVFWGR